MLSFGIEAKLSASRSSDENPFAEVPGVKDMRAICTHWQPTEIEMKEFYDAIIMTPTVFEKSLSKFFMFLVLFWFLIPESSQFGLVRCRSMIDQATVGQWGHVLWQDQG